MKWNLQGYVSFYLLLFVCRNCTFRRLWGVADFVFWVWFRILWSFEWKYNTESLKAVNCCSVHLESILVNLLQCPEWIIPWSICIVVVLIWCKGASLFCIAMLTWSQSWCCRACETFGCAAACSEWGRRRLAGSCFRLRSSWTCGSSWRILHQYDEFFLCW